MDSSTNLIQSLLKSGIHWGHQRSRRHPKMQPYIWGHKGNVNLFDLYQTASHLERAARFLHDVAAEGKTILWIGTKRPARESIEKVATALGMPQVTHRWIGGTLSNYGQVKKSVTKLLHFEDVVAKADSFSHYTKKEINTINKAVDRLKKNVGGIRSLRWPVAALVIIDINKERSALKEAVQVGVPVVALVDTNCDPSLVDYIIPGNDDAPRAISYIVEYLGNAVQKGQETAKANALSQAQEEALEVQTPQDAALAYIEVQEDEDSQSQGRKTAGRAGVKKADEGDKDRSRPARAPFRRPAGGASRAPKKPTSR